VFKRCPITLAVTLGALVALGAAPVAAQAATKTLRKNGAVVHEGSKITTVGYGQIKLISPGLEETEIECVNVGFGYLSNEPGRISGQILVWWASGHQATAEHTELSAKCRYVNEGGQQTAVAWATAEPRLHEVIQEGIVCANKEKPHLSECTGPNETEKNKSLIREVTRENLTLPWNGHLVEGVGANAGEAFSQLGESSEVGKTCGEAEHLATSAHVAPGCIRVQILVPELALDLPFEGGIDPKSLNGTRNGLSPSAWRFEGEHEYAGEGTERGAESLSYAKNRSIHGYTSGTVKILGFEGQELLTVE
jgi:hypothetical protein